MYIFKYCFIKTRVETYFKEVFKNEKARGKWEALKSFRGITTNIK